MEIAMCFRKSAATIEQQQAAAESAAETEEAKRLADLETSQRKQSDIFAAISKSTASTGGKGQAARSLLAMTGGFGRGGFLNRFDGKDRWS